MFSRLLKKSVFFGKTYLKIKFKIGIKHHKNIYIV